MIFIYMMMTFLAPVILATEILACDITQCDDECQCYGTTGEPLIFYLPVHEQIKLKKNKTTLFKCVNACKEENSNYIKSCKFVINGTLKCEHTTENDSGVYQLELYDQKGKNIKQVNINLQIIAPVSQPAMFQKCWSPEQRTVSCSAEGEHTHFSFSLDNNPLLHTKPTSENNGSVTISLNGQLQGNLECKVQNKVSSKQIIVHLSSCEETRFPAVIVLASATVLLLLLVLFLGIKLFKVKIRRSPTTTTEGDAEEEIVYSDVRVIRDARKRDG
ncbi:PREDICTED: T-cell surface antigen CD2-like [Poecilia mexicana]|uniref:T-cell surface antigen CD2-like n=1 Tax=Poecilia mexicana TaxID=48701 RepID=UPI00072E1876|nr:PREDICTED: T-cell surface antigen CD2-like [Poecilia mexicana]